MCNNRRSNQMSVCMGLFDFVRGRGFQLSRFSSHGDYFKSKMHYFHFFSFFLINKKIISNFFKKINKLLTIYF